jgi:type IV secretory pathway VirB4 component
LKKTKDIKLNSSLLNIITPIGLDIKRNMITIGENLGKSYGIVKYPEEPKYGWLKKITNINSTICSIHFKPIDGGTFLQSVSRNISMNKGIANSTKDELIKTRANKAIESGQKIMKRIEHQNEVVGKMGILMLPMASDEKNFNQITKKTNSKITSTGCKSRCLSFLQENAFKQMSPFYTKDNDVGNVIDRIIPLSTFIGGFPFANSGYNDGKGSYFAKDSSGGLIIVDIWKRGEDRTNSNFAIMGIPGVGKSTAIKHIVLSEYMMGTKLIFVDPHREYADICKNLNGDWINAGGGGNGKINPLQIRSVPRDEDEEQNNKLYKDEGNGMGDMALYIKNLEIFFSLYIPSLSDRERAILKSEIIELYNEFNIFWDTDISSLSNTDFPIMEDLYNQIFKKSKDKSNPYQKDYDNLALFLKDIACGSDSFLWNGYTNLNANSKCVVLDTKDLQNSPDNIISTQYFNILQWAWEEIVKNPNERVLLICDEAYLMINPKVPQSLVFLRNASKGLRKYEGGLAIISHSVVDFLAPEVKMYGQPLLDLACFKIIMGTDGKNLDETKDLYNLTEAEEELIASKQRGTALLIIGSKRLQIQFEIPDYKFDYMGKAGGR